MKESRDIVDDGCNEESIEIPSIEASRQSEKLCCRLLGQQETQVKFLNPTVAAVDDFPEVQNDLILGFGTQKRLDDNDQIGKIAPDFVDNVEVNKSIKGLRMSFEHLWNDEDIDPVLVEGSAFGEKYEELYGFDRWKELLRHLYVSEVKIADLQSLIFCLVGEKQDLMKEFNQFSENSTVLYTSVKKRGRDNDKKNAREEGKYKKHINKSSRESCNPSYRLLPESERRTKLNSEVLNDCKVAVPDYGSKPKEKMQINKCEQILFDYDDRHCELDILIGRIRSAMKNVTKLLWSSDLCVKDYLTVIDIRTIEHLYNEYGPDMLELLNENPKKVSPVILRRLQQKLGEYTRLRSDWNKVWAKGYAENYHISLDCKRQDLNKRRESRDREIVVP